MNKDLSLLRLFDTKFAKIGDTLVMVDRVVGFPDSIKDAVFRGMLSDGSCALIETRNEKTGRVEGAVVDPSMLRMAPLAWLKCKPVYAGDTLYYGSQQSKIFGRCDQTDKNLGVLLQCDTHGSMWTNCFTWEIRKPKVTKSGWVNIYSASRSNGLPADSYPMQQIWYSFEQAVAAREVNKAARGSSASLIFVDCVKIEWSEDEIDC